MFRTTKNQCKNRMDYREINHFYGMLLKYKNYHSGFNCKRVLLKLYPQIDWNLIKENTNK